MTPRSLLAPARLAGRPVLRSQTDERLVDLVRAGSEPAFEAIVARYRGPLLRYCRRILADARAEDAVQQTFVRAFAALHRDDAQIDLRPWLYRIAHNTSLNTLRDRGPAHAELDEGIDGVERPDQALERQHGLREVISAVQALPERQRDAMILRELEGRSYDEIAGELGITGGAVRQLLNRARTTLRAGATAVTPMPLLLRLSSGEGEPTAAQVAELVGAGGAGALATKVAATALVTAGVAGGIATVPADRNDGAKAEEAPAATSESSTVEDAAGSESAAPATPVDDRRGRRGVDEDEDRSGRDDDEADDDDDGEGDGDGDGDSSGRGDGDDDRSGGNSGPGSGDDDHSGGKSGPGSGDDGGDSSDSGSGSSGSGSSGSGSSGSGSSGSGSSGSGSSGSGSGSSGSGDDGSSGSGSSDSGSSGSGSGSSGSGSRDDG